MVQEGGTWCAFHLGGEEEMRKTSPPGWPTGAAYALRRGRRITQMSDFFLAHLG